MTNELVTFGADGSVSSTFQGRPCYRYVRRTDKLPTLADLPDDGDKAVCKVKLFNPAGIGTWWIASYDPDTRVAFGVAELDEREVGSFSLDEIGNLRPGPFGLPVERDLYYEPQTINELVGVS
jgi:hypothetical protein